MELMVTTGAIRCAKLRSDRHHQQTNVLTFCMPDHALPVTQPCQSTEGKSTESLSFCPLSTACLIRSVNCLFSSIIIHCYYQSAIPAWKYWPE